MVRTEMFVTKQNVGGAASDAHEIARLYAAMWRRFRPPRQGMAGSDVTPRMLGLLRHLDASGPLTVGEQATHLGISRATASELIDRLEARGLVDRIRDGRDQRRVFVWLTEEGRARVVSLAHAVLDTPFVDAVAAMTPTQRRQLIDALSALLRAAESTSLHKEKAS